MSQPPPLSSDPAYAEAIPVAYAFPGVSDVRPGVITTLGVSSIVIAVLQAGAAITVAFMAFALWIMSVIPPHQPSMTTVATANFPAGLPIHIAAPLTNRLTEIAGLSPARRESLDALLRHSGRDVAPSMVDGSVSAENVKRLFVSNATTSDGNDLLLLSTGRVELSDTEATFEPEGSIEVIVVETAEMGLNVVVPGQSTPAPPTTAASPQTVISAAQMLTWYGTSIASGLLAILLMIAGILALRGRKGGRRTHLWWAWLKLPIALAGAAGVGWMIWTFAEVGSTTTGNPNPTGNIGAAIVYAVIQAVLSVGHILTVLIVLNLAHVKAWFASRV